MIEPSVVLEKFAAFANLPTNNTERLLPLARLCAAQLTSRLKPGADTADNEEALSTAAAGMLFYQYSAMGGSSQNESFKLGDFSLSSGAEGGAGLAEAKALRGELLACVAPLLTHDGAFIITV